MFDDAMIIACHAVLFCNAWLSLLHSWCLCNLLMNTVNVVMCIPQR